MAFHFNQWIKSVRRIRKLSNRSTHRGFKVESLEDRRLLAASGSLTPTITGTVFLDSNNDGGASAGESIENANVQLYLDDGDGLFEPGAGDTQVSTLTDADGIYCFEDLDPTAGYFVFQPAQTVEGIALQESTSVLLNPGTPQTVVDSFDTTQIVTASPPAPSDESSSQAVASGDLLGGERDLTANLLAGDGAVSIESNPFGTRATLRLNADVGATGTGTLVWDGIDSDPDNLALGLGGIDLTNGGVNTGFVVNIGAEDVGATARVRLFDDNGANLSESTFAIPETTTGTADAYRFLPFSSFIGTANVTSIDAIEIFLDASNSPANDIEMSIIGANGPRIVNIANTPTADLSVTKTNNETTVVPGEQLTYTIVAQNAGPSNVVGARIVDDVPAEIVNVNFTSVAEGGATGNTTTGEGSIDETVSLPVDGSITYTVVGTLASNVNGSLSNTVTITAPEGVIDSSTDNNVAVDIDELEGRADLSITKTDNRTTVVPGETVEYDIVVANGGPSDVIGATIVDTFPETLTNVNFTSAATGTVSGQTPAGSGNINDLVSLTAGSTITYNVQGVLLSSATGQLTNTATVTAPADVVEINLENNTATDTDDINVDVDLAITKTDNRSTVGPNETLTYTVVVNNNGPSDVIGATIVDDFPASLANVSFTSAAADGATGNTESGTGSLAETVDLPAGSSITYTVVGTVLASTLGNIENTATVTAPEGVNEVNLDNNTATDANTLIPEFDLVVSKTDNRSSVVPGQTTTYSIVVSNAGPSDVSGVRVVDIFPTELTNVTYTSTPNGGATGNTLNSFGSIDDTVNLPAGSSVTYTASGTVAAGATDTLTNTVTVTAPDGLVEANTGNNSATDVDTITPEVDLSLEKSNDTTTVRPGQDLGYSIVVANAGPSDVVGATVVDTFPDKVTDVSFTSVATEGASGNTESGTDEINDVVNLAVGSSITYTVVGTVATTARGTILNTASITAPIGATELNSVNNSASETDEIDVVLQRITGKVYVDSNGNGALDAGEPPIPNVAIELNGSDTFGNPVSRLVQTNAAGEYAFNDLMPGTYSIQQAQPDGFADGPENIGTGAVIQPTVADNVFQDLGLGEQDAVEFNFGEQRPAFSKRDLFASFFAAR